MTRILCTIALALGLTVFGIGCGGEEETAGDKIGGAIDKGIEKADEAGEAVADKTEEAADEVEEAFENATE